MRSEPFCDGLNGRRSRARPDSQPLATGRRTIMPLLSLLFLIASLLLFFCLLVAAIRLQQQQQPLDPKNAKNVIPEPRNQDPAEAEAVPAPAEVWISERSLAAARIVQEVRIRNAQYKRSKISSFESRIQDWKVRRQEVGYTPRPRIRAKIARPPRLSPIAEECLPAHGDVA